MRGKILLKILEILKDQVMTQVDFFDAVLASGYGASMGKIEYEYQKRRKNSESEKLKVTELKNRKRRLQIFISKMKQDGLIHEIKENNFEISVKGKIKLAQLKNKMPSWHYEIETKDKVVIISFDIPEKLRRKRNWFREVIKNLGFNMIHQSVWMGKIKIPKELIVDLENMHILEFIEIFEISKTGTLKKL